MKAMNKTELQTLEKIHQALSTHKAKYVTAESLSREIGVLPEKIQQLCATFNPLVTIDFSFNLKELIPDIDKHLTSKVKKAVKKTVAIKKEVGSYQRLIDFVYDKMTFEGMLDKSIVLEDRELREIKAIASEELRVRRALKKKK